MPARLLLVCLLFRSSWLTVEGGSQIGAAGVLHRRGGRAAVAVSVGVAVGVPILKPRVPRIGAVVLLLRQRAAVGAGPSRARAARPGRSPGRRGADAHIGRESGSADRRDGDLGACRSGGPTSCSPLPASPGEALFNHIRMHVRSRVCRPWRPGRECSLSSPRRPAADGATTGTDRRRYGTPPGLADPKRRPCTDVGSRCLKGAARAWRHRSPRA